MFFMLKICFSLSNLLHYLRTSTCSNHLALLEKYDKPYATDFPRFSKVCNVIFDLILSTQLALLAEMGGLGVSSASLLAPTAFLASAFVVIDFPTTIFSETFEDVSFTVPLGKWLSLRMNNEVLLMDPRTIGHNLSMSKPHKIQF